MKSHRIHAVLLIVLLIIAASAANAALFRRSGDTSLSVYGAYDKVSEKPGFGLSLSKRDPVGITDLSGVVFDHSIMLQTSQLRPITLGLLPIYVGMTGAYSFEKNGSEVSGIPTGFMSGLQVVFAKAQPSAGLSLDLRASSLSQGFNPIKWVSDPDVLWFGAGFSYNF